MVEEDRANLGLTPEEKVAALLLSRHNLSPPVNVLELASKYASVEEEALPVLCDAVLVHRPQEDGPALILVNKSTNTRATRKRFTVAHEIGHIKIPWHCGSIACHVDEETIFISTGHHSSEGEADRFASELLMPTPWVQRVHREEISIERTFTRVVEGAKVSITAARIKLLKCLPPGYVCVEYDRSTHQVLRVNETAGSTLRLYLNFADRRDFSSILGKLEGHAVDGCTIDRGRYALRWWLLDCREDIPPIQEARNSADILRGIVEDRFPGRDRDFHNKLIYRLNGFASSANQAAPNREREVIYGALKLTFSKDDMLGAGSLRSVVNHPDFVVYMAVKSLELAGSVKVKGRRKRS